MIAHVSYLVELIGILIVMSFRDLTSSSIGQALCQCKAFFFFVKILFM